jgi:hypothetical protein
MIDGRTPTPRGDVPPHVVVGGFEVRDGMIVSNSYQANPNHQILSADGLFRLPPELHKRLMETITPVRSSTGRRAPES